MVRLSFAFVLMALTMNVWSSAARADLQSGINAYFDGDYQTAIEQLKPEAEAEDSIAQYYLGEIYLRGKGVEQNFVEAAAWFERAAQNGHPEAQAAIGSLEMLGLGVERHATSAYFWLIVSVVWQDSDLRPAAMSALGEVAIQLSPEQKHTIARAAVPQWKRSQ